MVSKVKANSRDYHDPCPNRKNRTVPNSRCLLHCIMCNILSAAAQGACPLPPYRRSRVMDKMHVVNAKAFPELLLENQQTVAKHHPPPTHLTPHDPLLAQHESITHLHTNS